MAIPAMPFSMKAQVLEEYNKPYALKNLPIPEICSENELLIRVDAAGYCHTDAVLAAGQMQPNPPRFPHIGSHEFAGTVVALPRLPSESVKEFQFGSRVGVPGRGFGSCRSCSECKDPTNGLAGYSYMCTNGGRSNGVSKDGGFCEYAIVDARQIVPLPDIMEAVDAAPLMCAGITIFNALKRCNLSPGQRVGIVGCGGGLGHLGLQFAVAMGLQTTGIDAADGPLQLARSLGTTACIFDARTTDAEDLAEQIGRADGKNDRASMGVDAVIILPESQASFDYGVKLLRNHGLCVVVSFPEKGFHVSARDLVFRDITVKGTILGSSATLRETVAFAAKHNVRAVKKTFGLARLNDLVEEYHKGCGGKLVVDMSI